MITGRVIIASVNDAELLNIRILLHTQMLPARKSVHNAWNTGKIYNRHINDSVEKVVFAYSLRYTAASTPTGVEISSEIITSKGYL